MSDAKRKQNLQPFPSGPAAWDIFVENALTVLGPARIVTSASMAAKNSFINGPSFKGPGVQVFVVSASALFVSQGSNSASKWQEIPVSGSVVPS